MVLLSITEAFDYSPPERGFIPPRSGLHSALEVGLPGLDGVALPPNAVDPHASIGVARAIGAFDNDAVKGRRA
jgi:hypothetical protein